MKFEDVYHEHWQKVFRLCMAYVNDHEQAQDLAQETFIKIWEQLGNFRNESSISTWIFKIASNNCLRQMEKEKKITKVSVPLQMTDEPEPSQDSNIALLYRFISELPEAERIIISLELEEVKQNDIAQIVGITEGNVRVKLHRIKDKLNKKFKEYGSRF